MSSRRRLIWATGAAVVATVSTGIFAFGPAWAVPAGGASTPGAVAAGLTPGPVGPAPPPVYDPRSVRTPSTRPSAGTAGRPSPAAGPGQAPGPKSPPPASPQSTPSAGPQPGPDIVEAVPPVPAVDGELPASPAEANPPAACATTAQQRDVEAYLAQIGGYGPMTVDGQQSAIDCEAIRRFQYRYGIRPVNGVAGALTADVAQRIAASRSPAGQAGCAAPVTGLTACIDLTAQTMWVVRDGRTVFGPTVVRTGRAGYDITPSGTFTISSRNPREWSYEFGEWMPYWQYFFQGGYGFHETGTYLHNGALGSNGCVNLLHGDAVALWNTTTVGTTVRIFGRRAGT